MGEMAGERSRMRFRANGKNHDQYEMNAVDIMTGEVLHRTLTDTTIRHKWPEEKPEHGKEYLVYSKDEECGCTAYIIAEWKDYLTADECRGPYGDIWEKDNSGWYHYSDDLYLIAVDGVECYWNLPEV